MFCPYVLRFIVYLNWGGKYSANYEFSIIKIGAEIILPLNYEFWIIKIGAEIILPLIVSIWRDFF
jgi:hypothetical protein